ncbi:hypothetical protein K466DRAFT_607449 [Polyporus arcularius HHB13444]|uniref:Uncharacterized protein n=1 Tax=Polyporus arcularius HHB13444 TaxID=1314778 RepID=A0A5C3NL96_9APHY|nr:hypothetical protein K466DRAFT_607449 [Polyporus arcularius HHB13444]
MLTSRALATSSEAVIVASVCEASLDGHLGHHHARRIHQQRLQPLRSSIAFKASFQTSCTRSRHCRASVIYLRAGPSQDFYGLTSETVVSSSRVPEALTRSTDRDDYHK